jgi:CheY-like chemotaxis protein
VFGLLDPHENLRSTNPSPASGRHRTRPGPDLICGRCLLGVASVTLRPVERILLATDSDNVFDEVDAALAGPGCTVSRVRAGRDVRAAVLEQEPDLVMLDLQIGEMGGVAACLDLRLEESGDRLPPQKIILLLDREADLFIARRAGADGGLVKPVDAGRLRRAAAAVEAGEVWRELDAAPA